MDYVPAPIYPLQPARQQGFLVLVFRDRSVLEEALRRALQEAYGASRVWLEEGQRRGNRVEVKVRYEAEGRVRTEKRISVHAFPNHYLVIVTELDDPHTPEPHLIAYILAEASARG